VSPGFFPGMTGAQYHADPCPVPSLSSGIAKTLIRRSPLHAHHEHPRFCAASRSATAPMEAGSVLHCLMLGRGDEYEAVDADDWRTKAAKERRDEIRAAGRIPMLAADLDTAREAAEAALGQMRQHPDCAGFFAPGTSEAVLIAQDGPTWLRCMVDRMPAEPGACWFDLKTTAMSAAPAEFQRTIIKEHAFQRAFYLRVGQLLGMRPREFLFVVVERKAPFAISTITAAPSLAVIAEGEVERAVRLWARCISSGTWPGYPAQTAYVSAPTWATAAEEAAAMEEDIEA